MIGIKIINQFLCKSILRIVRENKIAVVAVKAEQIFLWLYQNGLVIFDSRTPGNLINDVPTGFFDIGNLYDF